LRNTPERVACEAAAIIAVFAGTFAGFAWLMHRYLHFSWGQTVGFMLPVVVLLSGCGAYGFWLGLKARATGEDVVVLDNPTLRRIASLLVWAFLVLVPALLGLGFFFTHRHFLGLVASFVAAAVAFGGLKKIQLWKRRS
jgi:hypothetical protein